jgi:DNA-binding GntR family transcriptional regulator
MPRAQTVKSVRPKMNRAPAGGNRIRLVGSENHAEERMYRDVYDAVMEHRLPPQTKLTEQSLCEIYALARHNVRKVLARLQADGLVDLEPNRGAFIASPTPQEAGDMFELRQNLERLVIQKVAQHASPAALERLRALVQREREAWQTGNRSAWIRLSADFHVELARLSGNSMLTDLLRRLVSRTTLLIASVEAPGQNVCSFDEHQEILDQLAAGDKNGASRSMARHLQGCAHRTTIEPEKHFDLRSALIRE